MLVNAVTVVFAFFFYLSQNCEKQIVASICLSVCLSVLPSIRPSVYQSTWDKSATSGRIFMKCDIEDFSKILKKIIEVSLKFYKDTLHEYIYIYI